MAKMIVYRLSSEQYIEDLNGTGCDFGPGRWNEEKTRVLYTAEVFALSKLEILANSPVLPKNMAVVLIEIPEDASIKELTVEDLPANWEAYPHPQELKDISTKWIREKKYLVMKVPSAHSPYESNYLINPQHPDHSRLKIVEVKKHIFDERLKAAAKATKAKKNKTAKPDEEPQVVTLQEALKDPKNKAGGGKMRIFRFPKSK